MDHAIVRNARCMRKREKMTHNASVRGRFRRLQGRTLLRDGDLATLVREVDASPDPHRALMAARSNPRMLELMSRVLTVVGEDPLPEEL